MPRPPPTSTLFPYTTLFRSRVQRGRGTGGLHVGPPGPRPREARFRGSEPPRCSLAAPRRFASAKSCLDRKSTRLNSSHVRISYAVFCLKKKNNIQIHTQRQC